MEIPMISEFLEILQKIDGFQTKIFEKNKIIGFLSLKAIIKLLEGLLVKLKEKHDKIASDDIENIIPGIKLSKLKELFNK
ncbi:MAG: hypothetical protein ABGW65_06880 [Marinoscillum sp.]